MFEITTKEEAAKIRARGDGGEFADAIRKAMTDPVKASFDDAKAAGKAAAKVRGLAKRTGVADKIVVTVRGTIVLIAPFDKSAVGQKAPRKPRAAKPKAE